MVNRDFNEFKTSLTPPLDIEIPEDILEAFTTIHNYEDEQKRECLSGFLYGGLFPSLYRGEEPRDVDMVIQSPKMVELALKLDILRRQVAGSYSERQEIEENTQYLLNTMFPYSSRLMFNQESLKIRSDSQTLGSCIQITAMHHGTNRTRNLDVVFVSENITPYRMFAGKPDAPIRQAAYDFSTRQFIYHKDFPNHAKEWIFQPSDPDSISRESLDKAREKGMEIVM